MRKEFYTALLIFIGIFIIDQYIKYAFVNFGWGYDGPYVSLQLAYNYGVAFSMFAFLEEYLKYIQLILIGGGVVYLLINKDVFKEYHLPIALIFAGGLSNILDRFTYGAVVDYVYWHHWFEFAIFNLADVIIDLGVVLILYKQFTTKDKAKEK